ncbi:hypothetical protein J6A31_07550 [bacterium]|nr:hypothetical protein [bacterium]
MKTKKDGRYFNCYIDRRLFDEFEAVCDLYGKTKTRILEEAMQKIISPFYTYVEDGSPVLNIRDGYYIGVAEDNADVKVKFPCKILGTTMISGEPYVKIFKDDKIIQVHKNFVEEKS